MTLIVHHVRNALMKLPLPGGVKRFVDHPAGPLTIFFWAPLFKWMITIANIKDFKRPVENISINQQIAIFLTGVIWSRYSMVITPINFNLMSVNMAMSATAAYQLYRKYRFHQEGGSEAEVKPIEATTEAK